MKRFVKGPLNEAFYAAAAQFLLGLALAVWPSLSGQALCWGVAALCLIYGIYRTVLYITRDPVLAMLQHDLAAGLLGIGAGFKGRAALAKAGPTAAATLLKLVVLPAVFLPLAVAFGFTDEKLVALLVMLGSITTPASYVMARQMGHEGTLTGSVCAATTLLSALTLTGWLFWARSGGYIL